MAHYESEATVVIDGEETDVYVQFVVDEVNKVWHGTFETDELGLTFKLLDSRHASLRMPNGKEATITSDRDDGGEGTNFLGSGVPPL